MPLVKSDAHAMAEAVSAIVLMSDRQQLVLSSDSYISDNGTYIFSRNNNKAALDLLELKLDNNILSLNQQIIVRLKKWFSEQLNGLSEAPAFYISKSTLGHLQIVPIKKIKEESLRLYSLLDNKSDYYLKVSDSNVTSHQLVSSLVS